MHGITDVLSCAVKAILLPCAPCVISLKVDNRTKAPSSAHLVLSCPVRLFATAPIQALDLMRSRVFVIDSSNRNPGFSYCSKSLKKVTFEQNTFLFDSSNRNPEFFYRSKSLKKFCLTMTLFSSTQVSCMCFSMWLYRLIVESYY